MGRLVRCRGSAAVVKADASWAPFTALSNEEVGLLIFRAK